MCTCVDVHRKVEKKKSSISFDFKMFHYVAQYDTKTISDLVTQRGREREQER